jgi:hypothetical protein
MSRKIEGKSRASALSRDQIHRGPRLVVCWEISEPEGEISQSDALGNTNAVSRLALVVRSVAT